MAKRRSIAPQILVREGIKAADVSPDRQIAEALLDGEVVGRMHFKINGDVCEVLAFQGQRLGAISVARTMAESLRKWDGRRRRVTMHLCQTSDQHTNRAQRRFAEQIGFIAAKRPVRTCECCGGKAVAMQLKKSEM